MAFFNETRSSFINPLSAFAGAIADFFDRVADAQNRSIEVQRMQRLSDRQLEDIGIAREDIVRFVYRDIYHI